MAKTTKMMKASKASKASKKPKASNVHKDAPKVSKKMKVSKKLTDTVNTTPVQTTEPINVNSEPVQMVTTESHSVNIEEMVSTLLKEQSDIAALHKAHSRNIKEFLKLYKRERKSLTKKKKTPKDPSLPKKPNVFTTPTKISDKLCQFLKKPKGSLVARTAVTKSISKYIKAHNLSVPENKKQFIPDDSLKNILSPLQEKDLENGYTYFNLQRYIRNEFIKTPTVSNQVSSSSSL